MGNGNATSKSAQPHCGFLTYEGPWIKYSRSTLLRFQNTRKQPSWREIFPGTRGSKEKIYSTRLNFGFYLPCKQTIEYTWSIPWALKQVFVLDAGSFQQLLS